MDFGALIDGAAADDDPGEDAGGDFGVAAGDVLVAFADAVIGGDAAQLDGARHALIEALGDAALSDSAAVVALFNGIDRVADATGQPLDDWTDERTADLRATTRLGQFAEIRANLDEGLS